MSISEIIKQKNELLKKIGFNPYYHQLESALNSSLTIEGEEFINLASNNYLGIANDQRIKNAMVEGLEKYGVSFCATPVASGYSDLYHRLCKKLANFTGVEDSILFPSCYQANNGLFNALVKKEDVVIVDQYAHSSLIEGIKTTACKIRPFLHNSIASLENNLIHSQHHNQIFVVTESVFSTEGSIAPLIEINALCKKYGATLVVDDSHGIGVIGKNGKGVLSHFGIENFEGIYTASLGKAFANAGGMIGGKAELIDYLKYYCSHFVYSTVISPAIVAGIEKTIEIIEKEFSSISINLYENTKLLSNGIKSKFQLSDSVSPIISVVCGSTENAFLLSKYLFEHKILTTAFVYPSVPINSAVIRLIAAANLSKENLMKAVEIMNKYDSTKKQ